MKNIIVLNDPTKTIIDLAACISIRSCQEYNEEEMDNGDIHVHEGDVSIRFQFPSKCSEVPVLYPSELERDADYARILAKMQPNQ